jgi:SagB-type dehydrogenase family enzyme
MGSRNRRSGGAGAPGVAAAVGEAFQRGTRYLRGHLPASRMMVEPQPEAYKHYPGAARLALPQPSSEGGTPLWEVLAGRRSVRRFGGEPLQLHELSQLLWASQGITRRQREHAFRTAPSAGALYPIETYVVVHRVSSLEPGLYHYAVSEHALEQVRTGDLRESAAHAALDQRMAHDADTLFVWTAVFDRTTWKYGERGYRYIYLDAGHLVQNLALAAVALGLGSCQIAALYDREANELVGVDGDHESVLYMTVVGRRPE